MCGPVLPPRAPLQTQLGFVNFWEVSLTVTTMGSAVVRYLLLTSNGRQIGRADAEGWANLDPAQVGCGACMQSCTAASQQRYAPCR